MASHDAKIQHGYSRDTIDKAGAQISHIESEVSDTIGHSTLLIFKYLCIIHGQPSLFHCPFG